MRLWNSWLRQVAPQKLTLKCAIFAFCASVSATVATADLSLQRAVVIAAERDANVALLVGSETPRRYVEQTHHSDQDDHKFVHVGAPGHLVA